jgi:hypothetical protein
MTKRAGNHAKNAKELNGSNSSRKQPESLVEFFRQSPLVGLELDLERDRDLGRKIDLEDEAWWTP